MNHLDLFSGIGGFAYTAQHVWEDYNCLAFVDNNKFCQAVLRKRFPGVKIIDDIKKYNASHLKGKVDLLTGGFPCQPFSQAGKRKGESDDRYLWPHMLRVIKECRPTWILGENVAGIIQMALDQVLSDLESEGYATKTFVIPASAVNAPHRRDRVWIVGYSKSESIKEVGEVQKGKNTESSRSGGDASNPRSQEHDGIPSIGRKEVSETGRTSEDATDSDKWTSRPRNESESIESSQSESCTNDSNKGNASDSERIGRNQDIKPSELRSNMSEQPSVFCRISNTTKDDKITKRGKDDTYASCKRLEGSGNKNRRDDTVYNRGTNWGKNWSEVATRLCRVDDGLPARVDGLELSKAKHRVERLKSLGNAIVPQVAIEIMRAMKEAKS